MINTPHIKCEKQDIAEIVLMPGDPLRAKFIAETYLKDYKLINTIRNMLAYTGYYKDKKVTIFSSGMGMPSMGIYSYELYKFFDVKKIIRIGSCGAYTDKINLYDLILVNESYSDSSFALIQNGYDKKTIDASLELNDAIIDTALQLKISLNKGRIYSSDIFYKEKDDFNYLYTTKKCLGVEMESFALFHNAKVLGKEASCILTVSDNLVTKEATTSLEREQAFTKMMELALEAILL